MNGMGKRAKTVTDPALDALLEEAATCFERGDVPGALRAADAAIARAPRSAPALHYRAAALVELEALDEAAEVYERALGLDPDDLDLLFGAAELYVDRAQAADRDIEWLGRGLDLSLRGQRLARKQDDLELCGRLLPPGGDRPGPAWARGRGAPEAGRGAARPPPLRRRDARAGHRPLRAAQARRGPATAPRRRAAGTPRRVGAERDRAGGGAVRRPRGGGAALRQGAQARPRGVPAASHAGFGGVRRGAGGRARRAAGADPAVPRERGHHGGGDPGRP